MPHRRQIRGQASTRWYIRATDFQGKVHRVPAYEREGESRELEADVRSLARHRADGTIPGKRLLGRVERWPVRTRQKLVELGLIEEGHAPSRRSIDEEADAWGRHLQARGVTSTYVRVQTARVLGVLKGCKVRTLAGVRLARVQDHLDLLHQGGLSGRTCNGHVQALKAFCEWGRKQGRVPTNPLVDLSRVRAKRSFERRALDEAEAGRLITKTQREPERFGMTGPERSLLYRVALEAGLRRRELITLKVAALRLDAEPPMVWVRTEYAKSGREAHLPLRAETAALLREHVASTTFAGQRVFGMKPNHKTAAMLRADLAPAEIAVKTDDGIVDFHSLRHTMITRLARSGVHPKVAQELARHSTITLTMDVYSHVAPEEQVRAVEGLPGLGVG